MKNLYITAIDIGTNSFHMIIAKVDPTTYKFSIIDREKEFVRLGCNLFNSKYIDDAAIERSIETLQKFKKIFSGYKTIVRAIGTSAVREAKNSNKFIQKIKEKTGINVEVISGIEEARLIYKGVVNYLPIYEKQTLIFDIGGGSTEFLIAKKNKVLFGDSLKLGTIRMTDKFFIDKNYNLKNIKRCQYFIKGIVYSVARKIKDIDFEIAVGTSGTVLTVFNIAKNLYSNSKVKENILTKDNFKEIYKMIIKKMTPEKISNIPGMDEKRADIILPGIIILNEIFNQLNLREIMISNFALREGILFDTIERQINKKVLNQLKELRYNSIINLAKKFNIEIKHSFHTVKCALKIFDELKKLHKLGHKEREYLHYAAILHEIGLAISHSQHHIHSYYIIKNSELFGFTENEKEIIANICRYHRKSHPKEDHQNFLNLFNEDKIVVLKLSSILRIADGLDRLHSSLIEIDKCLVTKDKVKIILHYPFKENIYIDKWGADIKKNLFEEVFNKKVIFEYKPKK
ncbi:MAG: Ppx/GppA family phosphatase [Candidatus Goldbacteria bacterium]|nr:Ppx/GppA family phosphatase [Candidatus Goldiibacteriota bacterium]